MAKKKDEISPRIDIVGQEIKVGDIVVWDGKLRLVKNLGPKMASFYGKDRDYYEFLTVVTETIKQMSDDEVLTMLKMLKKSTFNAQYIVLALDAPSEQVLTHACNINPNVFEHIKDEGMKTLLRLINV